MAIGPGSIRLQWADPALQGQLDFTGPQAWPGLATHTVPDARTGGGAAHGQGRQILIGDFSAEDCDDYLARRLTRDQQPLIPADIRAVITARSHGLPLYLDLSVMRFLEIRRQGGSPSPTDFEADFAALIARTLQDLTPDERHVLRSVSLLDAFGVTLATRAAGLAREAPALRLVERPFVQQDPFALWPFHLHGVVGSTIRTADDPTDDRWSPTDWQHAAQRALTALGEQWTTAASPRSGRKLLVGCLRQGLRLAREHRLELDWLAEAGRRRTRPCRAVPDGAEPSRHPHHPPDHRPRPRRRNQQQRPGRTCAAAARRHRGRRPRLRPGHPRTRDVLPPRRPRRRRLRRGLHRPSARPHPRRRLRVLRRHRPLQAGLPHQPHSTVRWLHGPDAAWNNWRRIITTRQEFLERGGRL
ncbi:hypothetical protein [Streptomyces sp. NPDC006691]|uniref:hypothetical protein n=1 Tax=Streptomyces sp. NPDC006691 TaxID=3364757 RepID=UPI0036C281EA